MPLAQAVFPHLMAGLVSKALGVLYRIPLGRILGAEGMGLYQMAYPVFILAIIVARGGLPLAMARRIAEYEAIGDQSKIGSLFASARTMLIFRGLMCTLVLYLLAPSITEHILGDPRSELPLKALAPAVMLISVEGGWRGLLQGLKKHVYLAQAQILEQVCRTAIMIGLALIMIPYGLQHAAAGATGGAAGGALAAVIYLHLRSREILKASDRQDRVFSWRIARELRHAALPVMLGSLVMPVMQMANAVIIPVRLQAGGVSVREATTLFGQHTGMALALVGIPTVVTGALSAALVPEIASAKAGAEHEIVQMRMRQALGLSVIIAVPSAIGLYMLADNICLVLYRNPAAAVSLRWLALGTVGLCLAETSGALLHALDKGRLAAMAVLIGGLANATLAYHLCAWPAMNIRGAALGAVAGFTVTALLSLVFLGQSSVRFWPRAFMLRAMLAAVPMIQVINRSLVSTGSMAHRPLQRLLLTVAVGAFMYMAAAFALGLLDPLLRWRFWQRL